MVASVTDVCNKRKSGTLPTLAENHLRKFFVPLYVNQVTLAIMAGDSVAELSSQ
jgi:hypothetical protein